MSAAVPGRADRIGRHARCGLPSIALNVSREDSSQPSLHFNSVRQGKPQYMRRHIEAEYLCGLGNLIGEGNFGLTDVANAQLI